MHVHRVVLEITLVVAIAVPVRAQIPLGSEFRVDSNGAGSPYSNSTRRSVAVSPQGGFVVTWITTQRDIAARLYDATGRPRGPEFVVNTSTTDNQGNDSVAADDDGHFVVTWQRRSATASSIRGQRFDRSGARRGAEFLVSGQSTLSEIQPMVAVAPDGAFVAVWARTDGDSWGIFGRRFDPGGAPAGGEFQVNSYTTGQQDQPSVDTDAAGNFVVAWIACCTGGPSLDTARAQLFAADGTRLGSEFLVSSTGTGPQFRARVARSREGSFVVVWDEPGSIAARRFTAAGVPMGANFPVTTTGDRPAVDMDADGDFVVTWDMGPGQNGTAARRFESSGSSGAIFSVATSTPSRYPTIGLNAGGNFVVSWHSYPSSVHARRFAGGLLGGGLVMDAHATPASDGNGVLEPGENASVEPLWLNANFGPQAFTGGAASFTGPGTSGNPTYTITDGTADYGRVVSGATGSCSATGDCYALGITVPASRPIVHWDASFREDIAPATLGATKDWTLHVGDSFPDVPRSSLFYRFVETLLHHGITGGCTTTTFCPWSPTTREQMAVFVLVAKEGPAYSPPACTTPVFADVPAASAFCRWIEELARRGVIAGCGGGNYCPTGDVTREQMAVFVLRTLDGTLNPPACGTPMFNDVPAASLFCPWIEELARRGVVSGCGGGAYCPSSPVTREQMGVFLSLTFGLPLYGP